MNRIGVDFGTTNTTLSYIERDEPIPFQYGGAGGKTYVPSYLSFEKASPDEKRIGHEARGRNGDSDYQVFSRFKMLLNASGGDLDGRGFDGKYTPRLVTNWFLKELLRDYLEQKNAQKVESFVITVPEIWVREGRHAAREALKDICKGELHLPLTKILSEPEAACVYFAWKHKKQKGKSFEGHVLVFDYGGGTLDLSLARLEAEKITVLEGVGVGRLKDGALGKAGVAFDEAVIAHLYSGLGKERNPVDWQQHLTDFEDKKITHRSDVDKVLERVLVNANADKRLFVVDGMEVRGVDLLTVFAPFKTEVETSLTEMASLMERHKVNASSGDTFRVLMVGGFSQFYLVARTVKEFFRYMTSQDQRFNSGFDLADTALAIAKGAALVAAGKYEIDRVCPISVGYQALSPNGEIEDVILLKHGERLTKYATPAFCKRPVQVAGNSKLSIFLGISTGARRLVTLGRLDQFFPANYLEPQADGWLKFWKIGFSVDEDQMFTMHICEFNAKTQEITGNQRATALGNLEDRLDGIFIVEE